jgi:uncharacterized protein (TIGR03437 family)
MCICGVGPWVAAAVAASSPVLSGVVNAASYSVGAVSPGEMVTLFGSGMGPATLAGLSLDSSGKVSTAVAGTRVLFDGTPSPILYTSSSQVSVIVPYAVANRAVTQVAVEYLGVLSAASALTVAPAAPGIFTADSSGKGQGAVLNQDNSLNSALNPAGVGSVAILYATGEGQTNPPGDDGRLALGPTYPVPQLQVTATISGLTAQVLYAGAAPGEVAGFLQVNVVVPAGVTTGDAPVVLTIGGTPSQTGVTLAVGPGSFFNGADGKVGSISPCAIATIVAPGAAPGLQGSAAGGWVGALPNQLANDTVIFNSIAAPILNVTNIGGQETIAVQVPCELTPGDSVGVTVNRAAGSTTVSTKVLPASPGIYETVMSDGQKRAVLIRPDGSFVSLANPSRAGESLRLSTTGLGPTMPPLATNSHAAPGIDSLVLGQVIVGVNNAGVAVLSARAAPTLVGVYEVSFLVPADAPTGNDIVLSVAVNPSTGGPTLYSNGSRIPIVGSSSAGYAAREVKAGRPAVIVVSDLTIISGNNQTAVTGTAFATPLVVQANSGSDAVPGDVVQFGATGPVTLSLLTALTDARGQAQAMVVAGSTAGPATVTASLGGLTATFNLTVIPAGPMLTGKSFYNGADGVQGSISPCGTATIIAPGLAPAIQGYAAGTVVGALPYQLANATVSFGKIAAPILTVAHTGGQESIVFQVPCEITPGTVPVTVQVGGGASTTSINVLAASPGIFGSVMSDGQTRAVLTRPDGSFVSLQNPARRGETDRLYTTGLGVVTPALASNSIPVPGTDSLAVGQVIVGINNAGVQVVGARAAPDRIGVYEITFQVPLDAPTGNDIVLSVAVNTPGGSTAFSGGSRIPIQ